jgi:DNA-binding MarR family transcriptional regulator
MTRKDELFEQLIIAVFRLNGRLIDAGNHLVGEIGLTSAWWQVLGALSLSSTPLPVAHIARNMGLSRQSVQRIADLLVEKGLLRFEDNPHHQRAKLAVLTTKGAAAVRGAQERQRPWARNIAAGLTADEISGALAVLTHMGLRLEASEDFNQEEK